MVGWCLEIWSFFSGAMGLDLVFEREVLAPTLAVEIDKDCCDTIRRNRPDVTLVPRSISELDADDLFGARGTEEDVFLMLGGPPCQSFSPGGNRAAVNDPRGNLIYEYLRKVAAVRPQFFVLENVANLVTAALRHRPISERPGKHWSLKAYANGGMSRFTDAEPLDDDEQAGSAIKQILQDVRELGYNVSFGVVDAADYGAAQHRLRFILLGSRDGPAPPLPRPTHGPHAGVPYRTVGDVIADLLDSPGPHSVYTEPVAKFFDAIPQGGNWRDLPKDLQPIALGPSFAAGGGKTGFFRRLSWDAPSPTITGKVNRKATALCHPLRTRPLSVLECARIQGFPDEWKLEGSMAALYQQIGNAVPVHLGMACANAIKQMSKLPDSTWKLHEDYDMQLAASLARLRASASNKASRRKPATLPLFDSVP